MKMNRLTKTGILIIVIGLSFLVGTLYRSTKEGGGGSIGSGFDGLAPDDWSPRGNTGSSGAFGAYFQVPRDFRMDVKSNGTLDVYVLNSEGIRLWNTEGTLAPACSFEGVKQQVVTFHLNSRDNYMLLVHNPSKEAVEYLIEYSGYGIETDLLYASLGITALGAVVTIAGLISRGSRGRKQSAVHKRRCSASRRSGAPNTFSAHRSLHSPIFQPSGAKLDERRHIRKLRLNPDGHVIYKMEF